MTRILIFKSRLQPALAPICLQAQPDEPERQLSSPINPNFCPAGKPPFRSDC